MPEAARRALFVTHLLPLSEERAAVGVYRRQRMLIQAIKDVCAEVEVLVYVWPQGPLTVPGAEQMAAAALRNLWEGEFRVVICERDPEPKQHSFWRRYVRPAFGFLRLAAYEPLAGERQREALEGCLARRPDLIFVHRLNSMAPLLRASVPLPPVFLDLDDIEHVAYARSIGQAPTWPGKRLQYLQLPALMAGERRAIRLVKSVFVCSTSDRDRLRRLFRADNIEAIQNAVAIPARTALPSQATLLIIGSYGYAPNRVAVEYFLDHIWPLIRVEVPSAHLTIAGAGPERLRHHGQVPAGVEFAGYVADLDALYARTRMVPCTILSGGGTRVKIVEAAAYGRPVVSTHVGAEGLGMRDGVEILLRDGPREFAAACVELLLDERRANAIAQRARAFAVREFDRGHVSALLAALLRRGMRGDTSDATAG